MYIAETSPRRGRSVPLAEAGATSFPDALEETSIEEHDILGGSFLRRAPLSSDEDSQVTEMFWLNL